MDINIEYPPLIQKRFNLPGHTFALGNLLRVSGDNAFALAQANTLANSRAIGIARHINGDVVSICLQGFISDSAIVPNLPAGTLLYVSASVAGALTDTQPSPNDNAVAVIVEAGVSMFYMGTIRNYGGGGGGGVQSVTGESVDNTDPVNPIVNSWPLAGTGMDKANGTIEVDPAFAGPLIEQDFGGGDFVRLFFSPPGSIFLLWTDGSRQTYCEVGAGNVQIGSPGYNYKVEYNQFADAGTYPSINFINDKRWNFNGLAAPTVNDDATLGYGKDSGFIHNGRLYICDDPTPGAAVWNEVGAGGGGITLETNGTPNGDQTKLNLVAGTNITLTDDGLGNVTIDGVAPTYALLASNVTTASNGLSNISALSLPVEANSTYRVTFFGRAGCSGGGGIALSFNLPSGAEINTNLASRGSSVSGFIGQGTVIPTISAEITTFALQAGTVNAMFQVDAILKTGANAGNVIPQFRSITNTQVSTLFANTFFKIEKL